MSVIPNAKMLTVRKETDSLGEVDVPADLPGLPVIFQCVLEAREAFLEI
jgi:hypothetical protein